MAGRTAGEELPSTEALALLGAECVGVRSGGGRPANPPLVTSNEAPAPAPAVPLPPPSAAARPRPDAEEDRLPSGAAALGGMAVAGMAGVGVGESSREALLALDARLACPASDSAMLARLRSDTAARLLPGKL